MKPDWKDAPEWAQYLAMDSSGEWYWYENKPTIDGYEWLPTSGNINYAEDIVPDFKTTLEARP